MLGHRAGLIYPPGMYTSTDELALLARRLAAHDRVYNEGRLTNELSGSVLRASAV